MFTFWLYSTVTICWACLSVLYYCNGRPALGTFYLIAAILEGIAVYIVLKDLINISKNDNIIKEEDESIIPADIECINAQEYRYRHCKKCPAFIYCDLKYKKEDE